MPGGVEESGELEELAKKNLGINDEIASAAVAGLAKSVFYKNTMVKPQTII